MTENKIVGYKKIFGFVLPDWINEKMIRYSVAGLMTSVVILFVLLLVVWPSFKTVSSKNDLLVTSRRDLEALRVSGLGMDKLNSDLTEVEKNKILDAIPSEYSPEGAIYLLRKISSDTGVSIVSYTLPPGSLIGSEKGLSNTSSGGDMVDFTAYPIKITVSAPVESLLSFISKIESSLPFGIVSDLNLQEVVKLSRTSNDKTVQLAMEIRFYQSILKMVNINKLQTLTPENLSLAKELSAFNFLVVSETSENLGESQTTGVAGSVFGL